MKTIVIQTLEEESIGTVSQDERGELIVQGETPEYEAALRELIESLPYPIPYRTSEEKVTHNGIENITIVRLCQKEDPEFLNALKDILPWHTLLGKRIVGKFV